MEKSDTPAHEEGVEEEGGSADGHANSAGGGLFLHKENLQQSKSTREVNQSKAVNEGRQQSEGINKGRQQDKAEGCQQSKAKQQSQARQQNKQEQPVFSHRQGTDFLL